MEQIEMVKTDIIFGGGEMGKRIRDFDWDKTPLGNSEYWSQSLKSVVGLMLANRFPMILWWGKEYIQFYNDAYIPITGLKHPHKVLGVPGYEGWAEIWDVIGPLVDTPFKGGPPTWMDDILLILNRNNFIEETHFIIAYSPVPDVTAPNGIGGVLATVNETTETVIGKRQMETLKELGKNISATLSEAEVYEKVAEVFNSNIFDIPFALVYKIDDEGTTASIAASSGIDRGKIDLPCKIDLQVPDAGSTDIALAVAENKIVEAVNSGELKRWPKGAWDTTPDRVVHVPVKAANKKFPFAIISIGLNPHRKFDDGYKNFVTLISDQVSLGVNNAIAYEEERKRAEALQKLDQAKTIFFSNISHEFRTPLTLMLGTIEEALIDTTTTESNLQRMTVTHRNAMRLLKLVNTLLDFSRIESGRLKANYVRTDIASLTTNLAANFRSVIEKAGLIFKVETSPVKKPVYVDQPMWEKIVFNLLSNAFKYTLEGTITLHQFADKDQLVLEVKDTGVGIPENELPHMFERFHRVQHVTGRSYEGTGIGLSLIKELVQVHGGTISVTSEVGRGSTFSVAIPLDKKHLPVEHVSETTEALESIIHDTYVEEAKSLLAANVEAHAVEPGSGISTILVVDDNADMRQHIQSILQKHFTVITAVNGMDALHKIRTRKPELILSDIMMPVMDGIQLIKEVRNNGETAAIPVILLTARAGEESKAEGFETGADDYLVKPFAANELVTRIRAQVKLAHSRHRIAASEKQFKNVLLQSPSIFMILEGPEMRITFVNEPLLKSWDKDWEIVGKTLLEVLPELKDQAFPRLLDEVYRLGVERNGKEEKAVLINNGVAVERYYNYVYQPIFETDNIVSGITIMANDVTEQVVARKKVEESERELQELVRQAPVPIVLLEGELLITRVANDIALQVMGKTEKQILNKSIYEYFPELNDRLKIYKQVFHSGKPYVGKEENISYNRGNETYTGYFDVNYTPWYDSDGKIKGVMALGVEVTEKVIARRKMENISAELEMKVKERTVQLETQNVELEETKQTLEQKNLALSSSLNKLELLLKKLQEQKLKDEQKDDFILMASHELKTPLTTINGYVQLLMDLRTTVNQKAEDIPLFDSALKTIQKQIINLTGLISELLDLSKIEKGQLELNKTVFDLSELVTDVVTDVQYTTQHKIGLNILAKDKVWADKDRIMQVILNFITNAIKYSPGADKIEIKVFDAGQGQAAVSVKDYGIGINESDHQKIFERFYRAEGKKEKTFPGFGIGLFIASDIIKRHGGTIGVKSEKGNGAEFTFTLPVSAD